MEFVCIGEEVCLRFLSFVSGDVQWNKNQIFNLCLTVGYFWTTLLVMIVLYIFIYGISNDGFFSFSFSMEMHSRVDVASNLERKSRENARKMSSLVGMARKKLRQAWSYSICLFVI